MPRKELSRFPISLTEFVRRWNAGEDTPSLGNLLGTGPKPIGTFVSFVRRFPDIEMTKQKTGRKHHCDHCPKIFDMLESGQSFRFIAGSLGLTPLKVKNLVHMHRKLYPEEAPV